MAHCERVASCVPQQRHRPTVVGRPGEHDMHGDLAGRRTTFAQDPRSRVVQPVAFGGRQVIVDRRAQNRMREADRAARFHDAGGDQRRGRRLQVGAVQARQLGGVADLRAVAEHAERASERCRRRRQPRQAEQNRVGHAPRDDRADVGRSRRSRFKAASRRLGQQLADEKRIPARHLDARADKPIIRLAGQPRGDQRGHGRPRQRRWAQQLDGPIGNERGRLGGQRKIERASREDQPERLPLEPASDEPERPRRRCIAPLQIVDHEHQRRIRREIRREPVQAVLPRVAGIAGSWTRRRHTGGRCRRRGKHFRCQSRRSSQPAITLVDVSLEDRSLE
jgi:hypothetical protein